jgi:hypothetical protein
MPRSSLRVCLALLAFLLAAVPWAGAEPIQWSYQGQVVTTGPSDTSPYGNGPPDPHILISAYRSPGGGMSRDPGNQVQFADVSGSGSGAASVTAFQMRASTYFNSSWFTKDLHTFNLGIGIKDGTSGVTGAVSFQGALEGKMGGGIAARYVDLQVGFTGATQKSLVLGNHLYKVSIDPFHFQFTILNSDVKSYPTITPYQDVPINVQVSDVPEPSTLALVAAGLAGLGLRAWRRRRACREAAA